MTRPAMVATRSLKIWIPCGLTVLRLLLGPCAIILALQHAPRWIYAPLLAGGILSDIFDGVLARRLGVSRPWLRRFDSLTDILFYLCILGTTWLVARDTVIASTIPLGILLGSEIVCMATSLWRFGKLPATHCYSAKAYGIVLFATFFAVLCRDTGPLAFSILVPVGLIANTEVVAILLLSKSAPVDVLSVFTLSANRRSR